MKRLGIGLLLFLAALWIGESAAQEGAKPPSVTAEGRVIGDLNGDNTLDLRDVQISLRVALGLETLPPEKVFLGDLRPRSIWGGPLGDGKITVADAAALLMLALGLIKVEPAWKAVVEEERGLHLGPQEFYGSDDQHYRIIKENDQWKIAWSICRWDLKGKALPSRENMYSAFSDGTPIYEKIQLTDLDTGDKFYPNIVYYMVGLEHLLEGVIAFTDRWLKEYEGARFVLGNGYIGTFLCALLKDGSVKTLWIWPYDVLNIDLGPVVELPDGNVLKPSHTEEGIMMYIYSFKPNKWGEFPKPREIITKPISYKRLTLGIGVPVRDASLIGNKIVGTCIVKNSSISPERLKVPIFDYQPRPKEVRFRQQKYSYFIMVYEPETHRISLTDFRPRIVKEREKDTQTFMDGPVLIPNGLDESLLGLQKGEFFIVFNYAIYDANIKCESADSSIYPAHLEERLVEVRE